MQSGAKGAHSYAEGSQGTPNQGKRKRGGLGGSALQRVGVSLRRAPVFRGTMPPYNDQCSGQILAGGVPV